MARREIPATIPSLKWPLIWMALAVYMTAWSLYGAVAGLFGATESDDALAALFMCPLFALGIWAAAAFHRRRLDEREVWRHERFMRWVLADNLPAPETIDWDRFERLAEEALTQKREPLRQTPAAFVVNPERPA